MAIRIRKINNTTVALCAARSMEKAGDIYLDDSIHHALTVKFSLDFHCEGLMSIPFVYQTELDIIEKEESNNPNRTWWDTIYKKDEV